MTDKQLIQFFTEDHREADTDWTRVEEAASGGDAAAIGQAFAAFKSRMLRHFAMEEEVMFPAFEAKTGMQGGPTAVMRMEHEQMRGLLEQMTTALEAGDAQEVVDLGDTMLMLIQQHNQKEETILYPMAQQMLDGDWPEISSRLESY
jgi:hemerythrin-like domain-containing protein